MDLSVTRFRRIPGNTESPEYYQLGGFHPVLLGDVFKTRYEVVRKLGQGTKATVWLAKDQECDRSVALKIAVASTSQVNEESGFLDTLGRSNQNMPGRAYCQQLLDKFTLSGPNGQHLVLVLEPMAGSLADLLAIHRDDLGSPLRLPFVRESVKQLVLGLHFIHSSKILHQDIQPANILLQLGDHANVAELKQSQTSSDMYSVHRIDGQPLGDGVPPYLVEPRPLGIEALAISPFSPALKIAICDFGAASTFENVNDGHHAYPVRLQPPELVLGLKMHAPQADIWALGCLIYQVLTCRSLFYIDTSDSKEEQNDEYLQSVTEVLGPLPPSMLTLWPNRGDFVSSSGSLLETVIEEGISEPLEELVQMYKPDGMSEKEQLVFLDFLQGMLIVESDKRVTAQDLLVHSWIKGEV